jgi:two-component system LytT family sensor kinase
MPPAAQSIDPAVRRRITRLLVFGAIGIGLLDAIQFQLGAELRNDGGHYLNNLAGQLLPWCWLAALLPGVVRMADRWPVDGDRWGRNVALHLVAMTAFVILHIAGAIVAGVAFGRGPVVLEAFAMKLLLFRFPIDALAYWGAVAVVQAGRAGALAREREQTAIRLEASLAETRLAALRDRLNPHFVFNTLNAVSTLALREDHAGVIRTVDALSDLLRATLAEGKGQEVTLAEELAFLDRYLEIERLRLGNRVTFVRRVDESLGGVMVPVMLLQPLVENAVRHGAAVKPGPIRIEIRVEREGDAVVVEVTDTGPGFAPSRSANGTGIGLANTRARLTALYGTAGTLECGNAPSGGAIVTARVPFHRDSRS